MTNVEESPRDLNPIPEAAASEQFRLFIAIIVAEEVKTEMEKAQQAATRGFAIEKQEKKFTRHVTLGRAKDIGRREADVLSRLGAAMAGRFFGQWTADRVEIIRSELLAQGSRYTPVAVVPLVNLD